MTMLKFSCALQMLQKIFWVYKEMFLNANVRSTVLNLPAEEKEVLFYLLNGQWKRLTARWGESLSSEGNNEPLILHSYFPFPRRQHSTAAEICHTLFPTAILHYPNHKCQIQQILSRYFMKASYKNYIFCKILTMICKILRLFST